MELRDDGERYSGKGVVNAVDNVNGEIRDAVVGFEASISARSTADVDLDGTDNKARLGANAILGVSLAVARAAADELELPLYRYVGGTNAHVLPVPMMNVLNGGAHADNNVDVQEFMIMPVGAAGFREALRWGAETYHVLKACSPSGACPRPWATRAGSRPNLGSQRGGGAAARRGHRAGRLRARRRHRPRARRGGDRVLRRRRVPPRRRGAGPVAAEMVGLLAELCGSYPIVTIEDGCAEEDWDGWAELTESLGDRLQLVGDDLFVTNVERLTRGIEAGWPTPS